MAGATGTATQPTRRTEELNGNREQNRSPVRGCAHLCLAVMMVGQALLYVAIAWLSVSFVFGEGFRQRPIPLVVGLFVACFGLHLVSLGFALRVHGVRRLTWLIVGGAIAFRVILLFSQPIQEIDIYRYLWDGAAGARGVNPFRFAPADVLAVGAIDSTEVHDSFEPLARLVRLRDETAGLGEALHRIHYPELTTVYPPVSQVVFAVADRLTPRDAALSTRVTLMKAVLLTFDLATVALVLWLLSVSGKHLGWGIAYAWNPLVIKEFANSGHLDAIAVCLTTAAICCVTKHYVGSSKPAFRWTVAAAVLLGLAAGAKLYPIVLLPLLTLDLAYRTGFRHGVSFALIASLVSSACVAPMILSAAPEVAAQAPDGVAARSSGGVSSDAAFATAMSRRDAPRSGLAAFLSRWEMNDFLFLVVVENLRTAEASPHRPQPWFAVVPDDWRGRVVRPLARSLAVDHDRAGFLFARAVTVGLFLLVVAYLLVGVARNGALTQVLEAAFLTLAWFWLLSPTQNPWYWTWALPLIPFARGAAWLAVSGLVFLYYLRFWLMYHWPETAVWGTPYDGRRFFDFVLTWFEFGPWLAWLTVAAVARRLGGSSSPGRGRV